MPTIANKPQSTFTLAPAGTHVGRIFKFMNLGTSIQLFQGQPKPYPDTLVNFSFELPLELNKFTVKNPDGTEEEVEKPFAISREFTLSMGNKSNLRKFVEGVIGTKLDDEEAYAFDIEQLVGMACLVTINHKKSKDGTRTYAEVTSTAPLMKGMEVPAQFNESKILDVKTMSLEEISALPEFLRKKMEVSDEYKARFGGHDLDGEDAPPEDEINPDDIPFS